jgi:hypothetical protein
VRAGSKEQMLAEQREIELQQFIADCKEDARRAAEALADYERHGGTSLEDLKRELELKYGSHDLRRVLAVRRS